MSTDPPQKDTRVSFNDRRAFIVRNLRARGVLSLERLMAFAPSASSPSSLLGDIDFLNQLGFGVRISEFAGRRYLVDASARHIGAKIQRMDLNSDAKHSIAMGACSLMLNIPRSAPAPDHADERPKEEIYRRNELEESNPELSYLLPSQTILDLLKSQNSGDEGGASGRILDNVFRIERKLCTIWKFSNITIFADGGTTNDRLGLVLKDLFLPSSFSELRNLFVCTNSRWLFNTIADPEVCAKALITGGCQLGTDGATDALAGPYTQAWLSATEGMLKFACAFIGATAIVVDEQHGYALTDSFEERTVKEAVLGSHRSALKVLSVDRSKLHFSQMRDAHRFSAITPSQIDLVLTSAESMHPAETPDWKASRAGVIRTIRASGVPVLEMEILPSSLESMNSHVSEMNRGTEIRSRMQAGLIEDLISTLGYGGGKEHSESKYPSRVIELFVNCMAQAFLENKNTKSPMRDRVLELFEEQEAKNFIGTTRTCASNDVCPKTGTWRVTTNPQALTKKTRGEAMPLHAGQNVVWQLSV